ALDQQACHDPLQGLAVAPVSVVAEDRNDRGLGLCSAPGGFSRRGCARAQSHPHLAVGGNGRDGHLAVRAQPVGEPFLDVGETEAGGSPPAHQRGPPPPPPPPRARRQGPGEQSPPPPPPRRPPKIPPSA